MIKQIFKRSGLDTAGIFFSVTCAIHCALVPVITLAAPAIAGYFQSSWVHIGLILFVLPVALISFYISYKKSGDRTPFILGTIGIVFLIVGIYLHNHLYAHGHMGHVHSEEIFINILGSSFLIAAHVLNIRRGHTHNCKK